MQTRWQKNLIWSRLTEMQKMVLANSISKGKFLLEGSVPIFPGHNEPMGVSIPAIRIQFLRHFARHKYFMTSQLSPPVENQNWKGKMKNRFKKSRNEYLQKDHMRIKIKTKKMLFSKQIRKINCKLTKIKCWFWCVCSVWQYESYKPLSEVAGLN